MEDPAGEMLPNFVRHLCRQPRPAVEHGENNPQDLQAWVQHPSHEPQGALELGQPLQRVVLTLDGDEDGVGSDQAIQGEKAERGRAVEEDEVIGLLDPLKAEP
jgi:hypothetical protein